VSLALRPVPVPPSRCAYGHETFTTGADYIEGGVMVGYSACTACEDLRAHEEAYQEYLEANEAEGFVLLPRVEPVSHPSPQCECSGCRRFFASEGTAAAVLLAHGVVPR
jgi:hypothetical protein